MKGSFGVLLIAFFSSTPLFPMEMGDRLADTSRSTLVLVLGLSRSGTSCLTGTLNMMGLSLGDEKNIIGKVAHNQRGNFEHRPTLNI